MKLHLINSVLIASSVLIAQPVWADLSHPTPLKKEGKAGGGIDSFVAQQKNSITKVTAVRLNPRSKGLEVILDTPDGKSPQVFTFSFRNTLNFKNLFDVKYFEGAKATQQRVPWCAIYSSGNDFLGVLKAG